MAKASATNHDPNRPNVWGMCQNITIAAINKGQLPVILACIFGITVVCKMPPQYLPALANKLLEHAMVTGILGWIISFLLLATIFIGYRKLKSNKEGELNRLLEHNQKLQELLLNR